MAPNTNLLDDFLQLESFTRGVNFPVGWVPEPKKTREFMTLVKTFYLIMSVVMFS